jgi:cupin fold WbuC family metalloprotein
MMENSPRSFSRLALSAPATAVTPLTTSLMRSAVDASHVSHRRRMILPLHKSHVDSLHRMFNAMQPGTYIPPHRHATPPKDESVIVVKGAICFVSFDSLGNVDQMIDLIAGGETFGVDVVAGVFHTFLVLEPDTVMFEVKPGPYSATDDKDFATWAPREGDPAANEYRLSLEALRLIR